MLNQFNEIFKTRADEINTIVLSELGDYEDPSSTCLTLVSEIIPHSDYIDVTHGYPNHIYKTSVRYSAITRVIYKNK